MTAETPVPSWSVSRSSLWATCRRWYLLQHVLRARPATPVHRDRAYGILVHRGLEAAFRARSLARPGGDITMIDYLPYAREAIEAVEDATPRVRNDAVRAVARVLDGLPAPQPGAILGVELPFSLPIGRVLLKGVIDYALRTGPSSLHVRDWKTGKVDSDVDKLEQNLQLALYALAAARIWGWATTRITVGLYSVSIRAETFRDLTVETLDHFASRVEHDALEADDTERALRTDTVDPLYPPTPGDHCARCQFRPYCPLYANADLPIRRGVDIDIERARIAEDLAKRD